jgi:hypothetical protein
MDFGFWAPILTDGYVSWRVLELVKASSKS